MKKTLLLAPLALACLVAGCTQKTAEVQQPPENVNAARSAMPSSKSDAVQKAQDKLDKTMEKIEGKYAFKLNPQQNSNRSGWVVLEDMSPKTKVSIYLQPNTATTASEPAHIHLGSCPTPGAVKYPLTNVEKGKSETIVDATLTSLKAAGALSVNIHKSSTEMSKYIACGNLDFAAFDASVAQKQSDAQDKINNAKDKMASASGMTKGGSVQTLISGTDFDGIATIEAVGKNTKITVENFDKTNNTKVAQVVNLVKGTCGDPTALSQKVSDLKNHISTAVINKDWETLKAEKEGLVLMVQETKADLKDYKACAVVVARSAAASLKPSAKPSASVRSSISP